MMSDQNNRLRATAEPLPSMLLSQKFYSAKTIRTMSSQRTKRIKIDTEVPRRDGINGVAQPLGAVVDSLYADLIFFLNE